MTCCLFVVEINCREPVFKPNAKVLWNGTSHMGSVVYYECEEGYYTRSLRNYSVCGENGLWEDIDLWCEGATSDDHKIDKINLVSVGNLRSNRDLVEAITVILF